MGERREHPSVDTAMTYTADIPYENFLLDHIPAPPGETTSTHQEVFMRLANKRRQTSLDPEIYPSVKSDCEYDTTHAMVTAWMASQYTASILIPELRRLAEDWRVPMGPHKSGPETSPCEEFSKKVSELAANFDSRVTSLINELHIREQREVPQSQAEEVEKNPLLQDLQKLLTGLSPVLKFYAGLESTRIFSSDGTIIGNANQAVEKADAGALARQIAKNLKEDIDENAPWYDRRFATIPLRGWYFTITHLVIFLIILFK